ncbi:protein crumbs homolog 3a [Symphorus nematophorus]
MKWTRAEAPKSRSALTWPCWSQVEMAACPDVLARPGVVVRSVLLLVLSSNSVWGNYTILGNDTNSNSTNDQTPTPNIAAIVAPTVILGVLAIVLAVLAWLLCVVKKKRQTEGTYRPSAEEQSGASSVAVPDALKLPKEERLI